MNIKINLLPPEKKEEIRILGFIGIIIKIWSSALIALLVFSAFLFSFLKLIDFQKEQAEMNIAKIRENQLYRQVADIQNTVESYHDKSSKMLKGLSAKKANWEIFELINRSAQDGIYLRKVRIEAGKIVISGMAQDRQSLIKFKESLETSDMLKNFNSPISNLVSSEQANFEFNADLK